MTERELVRCLNDAEKGNEAALRRWMNATPDEEVTRRLRNIASRAAQSNNRLWFAPFSIVINVHALWRIFNEHKAVIIQLSVALFVFMQFCLVISDVNKWQVRRGRSAVLFLANRGDKEMLPVLASYYTRYFKGRTNWATKIENALITLLDRALGDTAVSAEQPELYKFVHNIAEKRPLHKANRDFPEGKAYVTAAAIRFLAHIGSLENQKLLIAISQQHAPDSGLLPNRFLVYDCAVQCSAKPVGGMATVSSLSLSHAQPVPATASCEANSSSNLPQETVPLLLTQPGSKVL